MNVQEEQNLMRKKKSIMAKQHKTNSINAGSTRPKKSSFYSGNNQLAQTLSPSASL